MSSVIDTIISSGQKAYIGINGVAKKVEKIYIGDSNIANTIFETRHSVEKNSSNIALSVPRTQLAATAIGDSYCLFCGGVDWYGTGIYNVSDAYDSDLIGSTLDPISGARRLLNGGSINGFALIAGGMTSADFNGWRSAVDTVDVYDGDLVKTNADPLSIARKDTCSANAGDYLLFIGGDMRDGSPIYDTPVTDAYDEDLVHSIPSPLARSRYDHSAVGANGRAIIAGGEFNKSNYTTDYTNLTEVYNKNLVLSSVENGLIEFAMHTATTNIGEYGIFAGGSTYRANIATVTAYDADLTTSSAPNMSTAHGWPSASSIARFAIVCGAESTDLYDSNLSKSVADSINRSEAEWLRENTIYSATIRNYAIFTEGCKRYSTYKQPLTAYEYV